MLLFLRMKIFVTGGSGVIGARVIPRLQAAGHDVIAPRRKELDLFDSTAVRNAVAPCDVVINLATAVPSPPMKGLLPFAWRKMDRIRRDASRIIADAALASNLAASVRVRAPDLIEVFQSLAETSHA